MLRGILYTFVDIIYTYIGKIHNFKLLKRNENVEFNEVFASNETLSLLFKKCKITHRIMYIHFDTIFDQRVYI